MPRSDSGRKISQLRLRSPHSLGRSCRHHRTRAEVLQKNKTDHQKDISGDILDFLILKTNSMRSV